MNGVKLKIIAAVPRQPARTTAAQVARRFVVGHAIARAIP